MNALPSFQTGKPRIEQGHVRPFDGVEIPFGIIEGSEPGPCLLVTAGVHGSEFCSIETAIRLMKRRPQDIKGTLVVLPILNVQGFHRRSIYIMPEDGKNLNRMFPGKADGSTSERLAHWLVTQVYPQVDAYLDLHGGDLSESLAPFTLYPNGCEKSKALATAFGIPVNIAAGGEGYTINAAYKVGVPSILPEVSGNGLWGEDTVGEMTAGVERVMHYLGMISGSVKSVLEKAPKFVTMWVPSAPCDGLWYAAKEISDSVAVGEVLGEVRDVFGKVLATIRSEKDGFILYRLTSLSVNKGEALLGVGTPLAH
ncbi:succinylglutamate desuccinylase/aspartoacylase family protein [Microvirga puerhi]|uniref:Succinylglutamate desuccinylase/aspartoacylase family protein n=1 Tax=Microvirga puerhi TaxID=2876078 RepID=A0ABS7VVS6_9HYPH|nr:M14 family metallopeptidase [Microvirga puerhi]MBZ6078968.1 succinylglutamate desuccinylase/aspartoacylase family protein [Microvirga puerhi]